MAITERHVDQLFSDLRATYGGRREDYFGILYLQQEFGLSIEQAGSRVAFGGNDYGLDGFQIDVPRRNLYYVHRARSVPFGRRLQPQHRLHEPAEAER